MSESAIKAAAIRLLRAREAAERAYRAKVDADKERDRATAELHGIMEDMDIASQTVDLGPPFGKVRLNPGVTRYGQITDPEDLREAVAAEGLEEELFLPKPAKARINELVNERLDHGQPLPKGLTWYDKKKITVTRVT